MSIFKMGWLFLAAIDISVGVWFVWVKNDKSGAAYWFSLGGIALGLANL